MWWGMLAQSYQDDRQAAGREARVLADQMANALRGQAEAMFGLLDYATRAFGAAWTEGGAPGLATAVRRLNGGVPGNPWLAVRVIDLGGNVTHELERVALLAMQAGDPAPLVAFHTQQSEPTLRIGVPFPHPAEARWALPMSFPLLDGTHVTGVIEVLVAPEHLNQGLRTAFPDTRNVAVLVNAQGQYLARSHAPQLLLGRSLPPDVPFLQPNAGPEGDYARFAAAEGIERFYAWKRLTDYPVVVIAGIDRHFAFDTVEAAIADSRRANLIGSLAVVAAALFLAALLWQRRRTWLAQRAHSERLDLALRGADLGWWDLDLRQKRLHFNEQWATLLGYDHRQMPSRLEAYAQWIHPDDLPAMRDAFAAHLKGQAARYQCEYRIQHRNGHWLWVLDRGQVLLRDPQGRALRAAGTLLDITARKAAEATLTTLARTDPLTGLANRRAFLDYLDSVLASPAARAGRGVLMLIDIDHFKQVNDTWGHAAGDRAMQHLAQLLRQGLRQDDIAARLGGEEFAVLVADLDIEGGLRLAERLRQRIADASVPGLPAVRLTISVGVAALGALAPDVILHQADQAMYAAKRAGRNRVCVAPHPAQRATA